ncbi:MAG: GspE/PulE family protein [bacterium]|nr:GspE/PulE family protein [Candidatus Sumerlaeota bacterium]
MAFFKKFVPGKGKDKDNGGSGSASDPVAGNDDLNVGDPLAGIDSGPAVDPRSQAQTRIPGSSLRPPGRMKPMIPSAEDAARPSGGLEDRKGRMGMLTDLNELAGKVRPQERLPELSVSPDADMLQLLSEQAGLQFVHLADYPKTNFTKELLRLLPAIVARNYKVFPISIGRDGLLTMAISDPSNVRIIDDLRLSLSDTRVRDINAVVATAEEIVDYINLYYGVGDKTLDQMVDEFEAGDTTGISERREGQLDLNDVDKIAGEAPIIKFCSLLFLQAIKDRASDLHIEPFSNSLRIRYRVDGVLREVPAPPKSWQAGIVSRFKVVGGLDISETRRPQDGRIKIWVEGREVDVRMSTLPVVHGECVVMRLLDRTMMMLGVGQIGMTEDVLARFVKLIQRPNGIILVTGPTGSGKTTSLYAALNEINDPSEKIITTEDPVEYQLDGVIQVNVNPGVGLTFARCLRSILRQDPDVILVGEIRDVETAQIAIQASLTGHLVFSTLHTNSAAATVTRLIDMGIEPFLITSTLEGIIGQRLVRIICSNCKRPYEPTDDELADFGTTREEVADITFFKGEGCGECGNSGYKRRIGIFELMTITDEIRTLILERGSTDDMHAKAMEQDMLTMRHDGWLKICLGVTTFEEVAKHTPRENYSVIRQEMANALEKTIASAHEHHHHEERPMSDITGTESAAG